MTYSVETDQYFDPTFDAMRKRAQEARDRVLVSRERMRASGSAAGLPADALERIANGEAGTGYAWQYIVSLENEIITLNQAVKHLQEYQSDLARLARNGGICELLGLLAKINPTEVTHH